MPQATSHPVLSPCTPPPLTGCTPPPHAAANAAKARLQAELVAARRDAAQFQSDTEATEAQLREDLDRTQEQLQRRVDELEQGLEESKAEAERFKSEAWESHKSNAKLSAEAERLRSELAGAALDAAELRDQTARQARLASSTQEELAAKGAETTHLARSLAECQQQLACVAEQADATWSQLQQLLAEQAAAHGDRQRLEGEVGRLDRQRAALAEALAQAQDEAARLHEFQAIFKRCEGDKLREAAGRLAAEQERHAAKVSAWQQRAAALQTELDACGSRCSCGEVEKESLRKQEGLLAAQLRDAQQSLAAAEEGRAAAQAQAQAASAALKRLTKQVQDTQLLLERCRGEKLSAAAAAREALGGEMARLQAAVAVAARVAAVQKVVADAWQRDAKSANDRAAACHARAAAAESALDALKLQVERDRGARAGGAAAVEVAAQEISAVKAQLAAAARQHRDYLEAQAAASAAELLRARFEAQTEQQHLRAAVERLEREADAAREEARQLRTAHLVMSAAAAPTAAAGFSPGVLQQQRQQVPTQHQTPGSDSAAAAARRAEIKHIINSAAAQIPTDQHHLQRPQQQQQQRRKPAGAAAASAPSAARGQGGGATARAAHHPPQQHHRPVSNGPTTYAGLGAERSSVAQAPAPAGEPPAAVAAPAEPDPQLQPSERANSNPPANPA
jgi:hypothetical protein